MRARVAAAAALALVASELLLRALGMPKKHDLAGSCDTRFAEVDARYGWVWRPSMAGVRRQGGREAHYAFDTERHRAASPAGVPDHGLPSILFAGESIMEGYALDWDETLPARVGGALGVQPVSLGVDGYGSDQAFLRLADALPQYSRVVAVVTLFFPGLVDRVAWVDHPRLFFEGDQARVVPGPPGFWTDLRLARVVREVWPGRDGAAMALTGRALRETARLARERGARPLFLAVHPGPDWAPGDREVVDALLAAQGLETLELSFDPIADHVHPDAASVRRMAAEVVAALRGQPLRPFTR